MPHPPHGSSVCNPPAAIAGKGSWSGLNFQFERVRIGADPERQRRCDAFLQVCPSRCCAVLRWAGQCNASGWHRMGRSGITLLKLRARPLLVRDYFLCRTCRPALPPTWPMLPLACCRSFSSARAAAWLR